MEENKINTHNFEKAKEDIRAFSHNLPSDPYFERVEKDVFWGLFDHNVTGEELNKFIGAVQYRFISTNKVLRNTVQEFKRIYEALDALDKDYINYILFSLGEAERANKKALLAQEDLQKTIETLQKVYVSLKTKIEEQQETYSEFISRHEQQINAISSENKEVRTEQERMNETIGILKNVHTKLKAKINEQQEMISELVSKQEQKNNIISSNKNDTKNAYLIAGFSLALALVQFVLLLTGIL